MPILSATSSQSIRLKPYHPSPQRATRRSAASLLPPSRTGIPLFRSGFRVHRMSANSCRLAQNTTRCHRATGYASQPRIQRFAHRDMSERHPSANSSRDQPIPTPRENRPAAEPVKAGGLLTTITGLCSRGSSGTPVAIPIVAVAAAANDSPIIGSINRRPPVRRSCRHRRTGVTRRRLVDHDDVLARPQCGEAVLLGRRGHGLDHRSFGAR